MQDYVADYLLKEWAKKVPKNQDNIYAETINKINGNENKNNYNCYVPNVGYDFKYNDPTLSYSLAEDTGVRRGNAWR
jgi:hypothetical protein